MGDTAGEWTLLEYHKAYFTPEGNRVMNKFFCRCSCGTERWLLVSTLARGESKSCGHARAPKPTKHAPGDVVGEWTLLEYLPGSMHPKRVAPRWKCRCSCGVIRNVMSNSLNMRESTSCGHTAKLERGMWGLTELQLRILAQMYEHGSDNEAIADSMGLKKGHVNRQVHRIYNRLRDKGIIPRLDDPRTATIAAWTLAQKELLRA